jgi:hypothetical protein
MVFAGKGLGVETDPTGTNLSDATRKVLGYPLENSSFSMIQGGNPYCWPDFSCFFQRSRRFQQPSERRCLERRFRLGVLASGLLLEQ